MLQSQRHAPTVPNAPANTTQRVWEGVADERSSAFVERPHPNPPHARTSEVLPTSDRRPSLSEGRVRYVRASSEVLPTSDRRPSLSVVDVRATQSFGRRVADERSSAFVERTGRTTCSSMAGCGVADERSSAFVERCGHSSRRSGSTGVADERSSAFVERCRTCRRPCGRLRVLPTSDRRPSLSEPRGAQPVGRTAGVADERSSAFVERRTHR
jgi:hypothetical protein